MPGRLGQVLGPTVFLALSPAARAHVLGDSGPLPSGHRQSLHLSHDSPAQTPGLGREVCVLTCTGEGWLEPDLIKGVSTPLQPPVFRVNCIAEKTQTETHFPSRNPAGPFNEAPLSTPA